VLKVDCYLTAVMQSTHFAGYRHREAICIMIIHLEASVESGIEFQDYRSLD